MKIFDDSFSRVALTLTIMMAILSLSVGVQADDKYRTTYFGNLAVEGYDTVAYFTEGKAVKGKKAFQTAWKDANWRFSTQEHLALFKASPEDYAPQYGGYCAWAVSDNSLAGIDPKQFEIVEGKLYLNYSKKIHQRWLPEKETLINKADQNWPNLIDGK